METKDKKPRRKLTALEITLLFIVMFFIGVAASDSLMVEVVGLICGGVK